MKIDKHKLFLNIVGALAIGAIFTSGVDILFALIMAILVASAVWIGCIIIK